MSRTVNCRKFKKELPGLEVPPLPGPKGIELFEQVSKDAWQAWLKHQTMLINEKHLNLMDITTRTYLAQQRDKFLADEEYDQADGYVPPEK